MKKQFIIAILACICAMPTIGFAQSPFVKLETVVAGDAEDQRVFFGRVVARETVDLSFQVGGQIVQFPVEEGAPVRAGDLVAQLDQEPFDLALAQANAQKAQADRAVVRFRELVGGAVTETTLLDAETQAELAGIAVRNAERALANSTLHAPYDGIVASRSVSNFATVSAGIPVLRLHDMSDLRVEIDVPETLFQRTALDTNMKLFAAFSSNSKEYPMELREFNAETGQIGQTYTITLGMAPQDDLNVLPGASSKVTALIATDNAGIIIPTSAVIAENDRTTSVMVFSPTGANEGTVSKTPIEIVPTDNGKVKVVSGLTQGQEIVVIGASALADGDTVRRFTGFGG